MIPAQKPTEKGSCIQGLLTGCLLVAVLLAMVMLGSYYYMSRHGAEVFSGLLVDFVDRTLAETSLPEDQQESIRKDVARLAEALQKEEIAQEQFLILTDSFGEGSIFLAFTLLRVERDWIPASGLSEDEKSDGNRVLHRTRKGLVEGGFDAEQVLFIRKAIPLEEDGWGGMQLIDNPTDEQVSNLVGDLGVVNNQSGVPDDGGKIDYSAFVRELVDRILGQSGTGPGMEPASEGIDSASPAVD